MELYVRFRKSCRFARSTKTSEGINRGTIASPHHAKARSPPILAKIVASGPFLNRKIAAHSINPSVCLFWLEIKPFSKHYSSAVIVVLILEW